MILAISNQKGGTGKSATAHNLAAILAAGGLRVLMVDCDPQGSLTQSCGVTAPKFSMSDVIGGAKPGLVPIGTILRSVAPGLDLAPSDISLASVELGLTNRLGREMAIKRALSGLVYDLVVLDCPPLWACLPLRPLRLAMRS